VAGGGRELSLRGVDRICPRFTHRRGGAPPRTRRRGPESGRFARLAARFGPGRRPGT